MLSGMHRLLSGVVVACVIAWPDGALLAGQNSAGSAAVAVDFFVSGPDGSIFDLRAEEVSLKIDGRARQIRSMRYVSLPSAKTADTPPPASELDPPFGTNVAEDGGRLVTIVADDESIRPGAEKNAINAAVRLVSSLGPRDRASYVTMPNGGVEVDFTTDHQKVIAALRRFIGRGAREPTVQDRSCRSRLVLNGMRDLLEGISELPGPKTVVLLSSGILNPRRDAPADRPPGLCEIRPLYFQEVATAATLARAHLFVVQPDELTVESTRNAFTAATASRFAEADADRAGLESLAGVTGGEFHRIVGPDDNTLATAVKGMSGYYVVTFDPDRAERNGFPHRVEITVARERARIRTRPDVVIPKLASKDVTTPSIADMMRSGATYSTLPLRAVALTSAAEGSGVKLTVMFEPAETGVTLTAAAVWLIDSRDRVQMQWTAGPNDLSGGIIVVGVKTVPGSYRLRVAATDSSGRGGTAEYDLIARLTEASPLSISGLVLGVARENRFAPKLVFTDDPSAVVYFEVYGTPPSPASVTVRVELADSADGRAVAAGSEARITTAAPDRRLVLAAVPIGWLAPGDYVVRAIVSVDGRPVGRVTRTLRKSPS
jgi:VWFA-related protein